MVTKWWGSLCHKMLVIGWDSDDYIPCLLHWAYVILLHWPGPQSMTGPLSTAEPAWSSSFAGQVHIPLNLNPSSSPILTTACCWASIPSFLLPKQCSREVFNYGHHIMLSRPPFLGSIKLLFNWNNCLILLKWVMDMMLSIHKSYCGSSLFHCAVNDDGFPSSAPLRSGHAVYFTSSGVVTPTQSWPTPDPAPLAAA